MSSGYVGIDKDYFVSVKEVLNITAETGVWETQTRVRKLPPADVVEIVRCCDCKHKEHCYSMVHMFVENERDTVHRYIDYCSYGEQKEHE